MQIPFELNNLLLAITVAQKAMIALTDTHRRENRLTESSQSVSQRVKTNIVLQREIAYRVNFLTAELDKQTKHPLFTLRHRHLPRPYHYKNMTEEVHQLKNKQGIIVNRRNHCIIQTIRRTAYIQAILHESILVKKIAQVQRKSMQRQLEIAVCFDITGREDESEQKSNPIKYKESRVTAANNFKEYVKNNEWAKKVFRDDEQFIDQFATDVIEHRGSTKASTEHLKTCSQVLEFAHNLDLSRCKNPRK